MDNRKRVTDEEIREQIGRRRGNITAVAQTLRCSRETVYKRLRQSEELRDRLAEVREAALDRAEHRMDVPGIGSRPINPYCHILLKRLTN